MRDVTREALKEAGYYLPVDHGPDMHKAMRALHNCLCRLDRNNQRPFRENLLGALNVWAKSEDLRTIEIEETIY